jgi:transcriptional regulator with XRE-family HTH domain
MNLKPGGQMAELLERIGHNVRRLREEKGWNQTELGYNAATSPSIISLIENGKRNPSTVTLAKIASALGVEPEALFAPKGRRRSSLEPSFNGLLEEERRSGYLRAWRAFVWRLVHRWEQEPPETSREIAVVLETMQALADEGAFAPVGGPEVIDQKVLVRGLERLNEIADTVKGDETAQQRRETFQALSGGLSA